MYLAVDIGATKTLVATFDTSGSIKEHVKFPTDPDYDKFLDSFRQNVVKLSTKKFLAAGLALPGRVDRKHGVGIAFGNLPWEMVPAQVDIEKILVCPVMVENDANLAGLAEAILLKKEFKKVLYITVSTGIGGCIIINGKIDLNFADSEVGHILLEHDGKLQRWEDFASGQAIKNKFGKLAEDITSPSDWYIISRNIAIGLIDLIATLTPEVIVLGGGVGAHFDKFENRLKEELKIYENPMLSMPVIRQAIHAEEAVIYGCYELIRSHHAPTP